MMLNNRKYNFGAGPATIPTSVLEEVKEELLDWKGKGLSVGSTVGVFGRRVQRFTAHLLRRNLAHVMSSDTHGPTGPRSPELGPGIAALTRLVGEVSARAMVVDTPRAILEGLAVEVDPPRSYASTRHWWRFWKR